MKIIVGAMCALAAAVGTSASAANIVQNGSFAQGYYNSANQPFFTSDYKYVAPTPGALYPETLFTIASDPFSVHPYWISLSGPQILIVNGATGGTATVWQENVATKAGQAYMFSASAANICCNATFGNNENDPSILDFEESTNGFASFISLGTITTHPPGDAGKFQSTQTEFVSTGPIELRVVDELSGQSGNDFAISDISVSAVPEPSVWIMMLGGLGIIGGMLRITKDRRREKHFANVAAA